MTRENIPALATDPEAHFIGTDPTGNELYAGISGLIGTRTTVLEPGDPVMLPSGAGAASTPAA